MDKTIEINYAHVKNMIAIFIDKITPDLMYKHLQLLLSKSNPKHNPKIIFQNPRLFVFNVYHLQSNPYI
ncbi:MAG: hypothetical protein CL768_06530 [Chloroflexi bacterium]|nr:hypothetical protein [Chloroflexota bacterium]